MKNIDVNEVFLASREKTFKVRYYVKCFCVELNKQYMTVKDAWFDYKTMCENNNMYAPSYPNFQSTLKKHGKYKGLTYTFAD